MKSLHDYRGEERAALRRLRRSGADLNGWTELHVEAVDKSVALVAALQRYRETAGP